MKYLFDPSLDLILSLIKRKSLFVLAVLLFIGCKKDKKSTPPAATGPVDVYVAGYTVAADGSYLATYWKNGIGATVTDKTLDSRAYAISVKGSDVYMAGFAQDGASQAQAVYWKNGTTVSINSPVNSNAYAIFLDGNNVLVAGRTGANAVYWNNGIVTSLPAGSSNSITAGIAANGNDIYVGGEIYFSGSSTAVYWKNGKTIKMSDSLVNSYANAMTMNNNDLYLAGYTTQVVNSSTILVATYWKNGTPIILTPGLMSQANAITLNGGDIYVAGSRTINNHLTAAFWKNGKETDLTPGTYDSEINAIAVNGSDVYLAGMVDGNPYYWINGVPFELDINGIASGIALAQQ